MNKKEFLDILRQSLVGEVDNVVIEQNIRFYSEYIGSHNDKSEEEIIDEIGDPRLIAKTIIETEKIPDHGNYGWNSYDNRSNYHGYDEHKDYRSTSNRNNEYPRMRWYHKVLFVGFLLLTFFILLRAGWLLIRLLSIFTVPIIIIALVWYMFRD